MFPPSYSCSRSQPPRASIIHQLERQLHLSKVPPKMFAVLHRYALDFPSYFIIHPSSFRRIHRLKRQLHLQKSHPKTFSVSSQLKYVAGIKLSTRTYHAKIDIVMESCIWQMFIL